MKRLVLLIVLLCVALAQAQVIGFGGQVATSFATTLAQCPTLPPAPPQYFVCVVVPGGSTTPFLALSVSGWNSGAAFQLAGLTLNGSATPGNLIVFSGLGQVRDGGAVPVVPANIVTSPALVASGHLLVAGTNPLNAVDGGAVPAVPGNLVTYAGPMTMGHALMVSSTSGQVVDAGFAFPNLLNLTAINCKTAALSNGTITCGAGSSIQ